MKNKLLAATAIIVGFMGSAHAGGHGAFNPVSALPDAQAGQCFARITLPAEYDIVPETVVVEEAYERLSIVDTQFGPSSLEVKVKDEGVRYEVRQPVYETVTEQVLIKPAHERLQVVPAKFENVTETIIVEEARKVWKAGSNLSSHRKIDEQTGQVYCLVDIPAQTRSVTRRVMVQPEQIVRVPVEAQYATVQKRVLVDRGGVAEVPTAPEFKTVSTQEILNQAHTTSTLTAPRTDIVERTVLRSPERFEWVEVLCDTNAQTSSITDLQRALRDQGYYNGPIDGIIGPQTEAAVRKFQSANGLPHQGFVTMETLNRLGLSGVHQSQQHSSHQVQTSNIVEQSYTEQYTAPVQNHVQGQTQQRRFQPEIMPHPPRSKDFMHNEVPLQEGQTIHRDGQQSSLKEDRAQTMANEFEAYASALTGRQAADQMLANGGSSMGIMTEEDLMNRVEGEVSEATSHSEPLTTQTGFQRPAQYSVRNRLNWDDKN